jgi:hypothetical protein
MKSVSRAVFLHLELIGSHDGRLRPRTVARVALSGVTIGFTRRSHSRSAKVSKAATGGARRDTEGGFDPMAGAGPRRSSEPAASGT